jgi:hypothetical protein
LSRIRRRMKETPKMKKNGIADFTKLELIGFLTI